MSAFFDIADKAAEMLRARPALDSVEIVVDRQRDIQAEYLKATRKKKGLLTIGWVGSENRERNASGPRLLSTYEATLFTLPILRNGQAPADDLIEDVCRALHDWQVETRDHCMNFAAVTTVRTLPVTTEKGGFLVIAVRFELPIQL